MKKLLCLLLLISVLLFGCGSLILQSAFRQNAFKPDSMEDFRFVVMGDNRPWWKGKDIITQNEHFLGNIDRANVSGADFSVIVGDLIHGYTEDSDLVHRQWDAYDRACKRFKIPYVSVVGNHDVWDEQSQNIWQKRYGPQYFSWDHKGCHFIGLSSEVVGETNRITGEQLKWLKRDLEKAASARRVFVFLHKPLWAYGQKGKTELNQWNTDVHPLLARYGVDTVFAGHWHQYTLYPTKDDVRYVVTGGAGAEIGRYELEGGFFHFVMADVKGSSSSLRVVKADEELPPECVTPEKIEALRNALSVEPIARYTPEDGHAALKVRVKNVTWREVKAVVTMDTNGTAWNVEKTEAIIPAGEEKVLTIEAQIDGRLLPLPRGSLEFVDGERKLFRWRVFVPQALSELMRFITEWNVVGPFDLGFVDITDEQRRDKERYSITPMAGWDELLPPEKGLKLTGVYKGKGEKKVQWQIVKADDRGHINLDGLYDDNDYAVACAVTYIHSAEGGKYEMSTGSDDSILVRINGNEVWRYHAQRGAAPDQDVFEAELSKGWNEVFLKIGERWGGWGFYFRVIDPEQTLKFSASPVP